MASENRTGNIRTVSQIAAMVGIAFGLLAVALLFFYVWVAFEDMRSRLLWWAVLSILASLIFIMGYAVASEMVKGREREQRHRPE